MLKRTSRCCVYCHKELYVSNVGHNVHLRHCQIYRDVRQLGPVPNTFSGIIGKAWNSGLTKETDARVKRTGESISNLYKNGNRVHPNKGTTLSKERKKARSEYMKLAHQEGRAHNIGLLRKDRKPSFAESYFMGAIENEFEDKDYTREYPVPSSKPHGIYLLDFAWPHKMKEIEVDGQMHFRYKDRQVQDQKRDLHLTSLGWKILRVKWEDLRKDPKSRIQKAKDFIDG